MASITGAADERIFRLERWLGLHECPDGDTKLKLGEASVIRNFRVTRDGNLQKRPGYKTLITLSEGNPVRGMWTGFVADVERFIVACGGKLYSVWDGTDFTASEIGTVDTTGSVFMFGYGGKLYIMDGHKYREWDGTTYAEVNGYTPLIMTELEPGGAGNTAEGINKLTAKRRVWISPDGTATVFNLPEKGIASVDKISYTATGTVIPTTDYTADNVSGTITFTTAPTTGVNTIEVEYSASASFRSQVEGMRYAELYNGAQDSRVFLYGDGTNKALYSGLDYNGQQRADYFPDLNEIAVGDENTPITGMIRHFSQLVCYKSNSTWQISATTTTLADGNTITAYYVTPTNKIIGNAAMGQVQLVLNSPFALFGNDLYEWSNSSYYTSNLTRDERQAKRISDRIYSTLSKFNTANCICYDDNDAQEYYICHGTDALVYNYAANAWYYYTDFDAQRLCSFHGTLFIGTSSGHFAEFSEDYRTNDGAAIKAYWESGSIDFGRNYQHKYAAMLWLGIKPQEKSSLTVTVQTDKSISYAEKLLTSTFFGFTAFNFADVKFTVNQRPQISRIKIKAKKFVYYKLIFFDESLDGTCTVVASDIRVRFTGYAK